MAVAAPVVSLENVGRHFDGRPVLSGIDLRIAPGEFVTLVGRSGCGKSTLLKIAGGLDREASGRIEVPTRRAIVFQDARLLPWKRVWRNVVIGLNGSPTELRARALAALSEVGLAERADAWPLTLSGGEAQRVAIARALVRTPELLLLDEPFAALDALTRLQMQRQVGTLWRHHQVATLFVTHDIDEALLLADRIILLERGVIESETPVLMPHPRHRESARFVALRRELLARLGVVDEEVEAREDSAAHGRQPGLSLANGR
jgi:sulfonate transport system ATP-binding protein